MPILCALLLNAGAAHAHAYAIGDVRVQHPWIRATPVGTRQAAAFMRIYNKGHTAERLISATSPVAGRVELRAADSSASAIALPVGKAVELEPGGLHLLLADLERPLLKGERIVLLLRFERAGDLRIEVEVQSAASKRPRH
jgi:copper(I)-binding protein